MKHSDVSLKLESDNIAWDIIMNTIVTRKKFRLVVQKMGAITFCNRLNINSTNI